MLTRRPVASSTVRQEHADATFELQGNDAPSSHGSRRSQASPRPVVHDRDAEGNARLTAGTGAILLVLLAVEGLTVLRIHALLVPHIFIGMLLVPPILLKVGSTLWRFSRYYLGRRSYRRRGPPPLVLRVLGPFVVILTITLFASGVALLFVPPAARGALLLLHKASFVLWFCAMTVHVIAHVLDTARLAPRDLVSRTRLQVRGASARQWTIVASLVAGVLLAVGVTPHAGEWLHLPSG